MEETNLIDIMLSEGDSTSKLKKLSALEKSGFPVLKLLLDNYIDLFNKLSEIGNLLDIDIKTPEDIEEVVNKVKKIKSPVPSSPDEMTRKLNELQETLRRINSSL